MKKFEDMTHAEINAEIDALEEQRGRINDYLGELRRRLALDACPYQVGDVLVNKNGERARIDEIGADKIHRGQYRLVGLYLKADGTPARNPGRDNTSFRFCPFHEWNGWKRPEGGSE